jgi:hypothetical protein
MAAVFIRLFLPHALSTLKLPMKAALSLAVLLSLLLGAAAQQTPEAEIASTLEGFKQAFARQDAAEAKAVGPAKTAYLQELAKLQDAAKAKGNLDALVDAEAALKAAQDEVPAPPAKVLGAAIAQARANYEKAREAAIRTYASGRPRIEAEFERSMTALEQKFTRAGNLAAANEAREAKSSMALGSGANILSSMKGETKAHEGIVVLARGKSLVTDKAYAPPIEITYVIKTDGQIRIGYAADQIILNWEVNRSELRIDGGPAKGQHVKGQGAIPTNSWLTNEMSVSVNGDRRAHWTADFRKINSPIKISTPDSTLELKQVTVRKLDGAK